MRTSRSSGASSATKIVAPQHTKITSDVSSSVLRTIPRMCDLNAFAIDSHISKLFFYVEIAFFMSNYHSHSM